MVVLVKIVMFVIVVILMQGVIMIDLETLKRNTDLLALIGGELKRVANTGGGEYAGPCPWCGGRDRFRVQPMAGRWMCRQCSNGWHDAIDFVIKRDNCDFKQAIQTLGGGAHYVPGLPHKSEPVPAYEPPAQVWQAEVNEFVAAAQAALRDSENKRALDWLHKRGLTDKTIKRYELGFTHGGQVSGHGVPKGITIPCSVAGVLWYCKIRTASNEPSEKYKHVTGSKPLAIYGADDFIPGQPALFCEGEFDCMIAHQVLGDVLPCATFGSCKNLPDLATWGDCFLPLKAALVTYDNDQPGQEGAQRAVDLLGRRGKAAPLPDGDWKDLTDFYLAGGDLWAWIKPYLEEYDPLPTTAV
jgi:DNA primase